VYFSVHHHDLETAQTGRLPWLIDWRRISAVIAAIAAAQVADLAKQTASMLLDQSNSLECAMGALPIQQPLSFATQPHTAKFPTPPYALSGLPLSAHIRPTPKNWSGWCSRASQQVAAHTCAAASQASRSTSR